MDRTLIALGAGVGTLALLFGFPAVNGAGSRSAAPAHSAHRTDRMSPPSTTAALRRVPRIRGRFGSSTNWSGYAVDTSPGGVTEVTGNWTVPAVTAGSNCPSSYSAAWVGIDGDTDSTVEQCGTEQDSSGAYYAWYEMYPKGSATLFYVQPGDSMHADVMYTPTTGKFTLTIQDERTGGGHFTTTQKLNQAKRASAEWIMEAPWSGGVLPLARWSSFGFGSCQAAVNGAGLQGLSSLNSQSINMVSAKDSATVKAAPGPVSSDSFLIAWMACE